MVVKLLKNGTIKKQGEWGLLSFCFPNFRVAKYPMLLFSVTKYNFIRNIAKAAALPSPASQRAPNSFPSLPPSLRPSLPPSLPPSLHISYFIFDLVRKQKTVTDWEAWVGLYRKADNKFYWINDTPLLGQYSGWASGEPNGLHEKCGHMYGTGPRQGKWNDISFAIDAKYLRHAPVVLCKKKST